MFSFSLLELVQKTVEITHNKHIPTVSRLEKIQNRLKKQLYLFQTQVQT